VEVCWVMENPRSRSYNPTMLHRHLTHQQFTLAAIDDVIARGKRRDWAELRRAALADRAVLEKALRVCQAHVADPYAQRYRFWQQYAERHLA
jgi:hypothetical protein